ncbi:hypothetical protein DKM44_12955 [Deinococcus irradiatisoli]|uniref:Uncharacterized protein n=1 Tax=Deinococcus irradiatisoli TaxID=2202254 RepID=A0A2Z3JL85_9DEIO|nr:hypothetical protein [Deinococcus irradiatisoli]AWN24030.1 hypothetical protein DKM44_12955 [Deinococcus irradiatisoli]
MGFKPRKTASTFERVTFPLGETVMTLDSIKAFWSEPSEWKPEGGLTFLLSWKDDEGDEHTEFPAAPKGFGYNEKSTFWNRIAALAGKTGFGDEDFDDDGELSTVDLELPGMETYKDGDPVAHFVKITLKDRQGQFLKDQNGKNIKVDFDVLYRGESIVKKQCRLVMGPRKDKDGNVQDGNKVAQNGALPLSTGGGKKKGNTAPPPSAAQAPSAAMP